MSPLICTSIYFLLINQVSSNVIRNKRDIADSALTTVQHILRNDDLECLPRLLCEYAAGGSPGQWRALKIDTSSLFNLLQYMGIFGSSTKSPMMGLAKAAYLGISNKGDSYECYRSFPRCPRGQERLLYYLNNHRGGFFKGFNYYSRNGESRIVNKSIYSGPDSYHEYYKTNEEENNFKFSNHQRKPKEYISNVAVSDRLPNNVNFPRDLPSDIFRLAEPVHENKNLNFFPI